MSSDNIILIVIGVVVAFIVIRYLIKSVKSAKSGGCSCGSSCCSDPAHHVTGTNHSEAHHHEKSQKVR